MQSSNLYMRGLHDQVCVPDATLLFSGRECDHSLKHFAEGHPPMPRIHTTKDRRLEEARIRKKHWKRWGPYLSERQWGTVREDYSPGGTAWEYFPHDHARSRAYRWGEDVKEQYFYLESTPTHTYMRMLYKYPQGEFPYGWLVEENRRRGKGQAEYELLDTGVFAENRYFDVFVE